MPDSTGDPRDSTAAGTRSPTSRAMRQALRPASWPPPNGRSAARGRFTIVLAGGNTPRGAYELLRAAPADWSDWQVYFGDERCTAADDAERNSRMAELAWLDHVAIPAGRIHEMPAELGPVEAAARYEEALVGVGRFDLVLLGIGEDGHTGSLFPGHEPGRGAYAPTCCRYSARRSRRRSACR